MNNNLQSLEITKSEIKQIAKLSNISYYVPGIIIRENINSRQRRLLVKKMTIMQRGFYIIYPTVAIVPLLKVFQLLKDLYQFWLENNSGSQNELKYFLSWLLSWLEEITYNSSGHANHEINTVAFAITDLFFSWIMLYLITIAYNETRKQIKELKHSEPTPLGVILDEINKYNQTIFQLNHLNNINPNQNTRNQIVTALKILRTDLIRALKVERKRRENRNLNQSQFDIDLSELRKLELNQEINEYRAIIEEALQIATRVQKVMTI